MSPVIRLKSLKFLETIALKAEFEFHEVKWIPPPGVGGCRAGIRDLSKFLGGIRDLRSFGPVWELRDLRAWGVSGNAKNDVFQHLDSVESDFFACGAIGRDLRLVDHNYPSCNPT